MVCAKVMEASQAPGNLFDFVAWTREYERCEEEGGRWGCLCLHVYPRVYTRHAHPRVHTMRMRTLVYILVYTLVHTPRLPTPEGLMANTTGG
jgi:hypothetical protein